MSSIQLSANVEQYIKCYPPKMAIKRLTEVFQINGIQAEYIYKNWRREYLKRYGA